MAEDGRNGSRYQLAFPSDCGIGDITQRPPAVKATVGREIVPAGMTTLTLQVVRSPLTLRLDHAYQWFRNSTPHSGFCPRSLANLPALHHPTSRQPYRTPCYRRNRPPMIDSYNTRDISCCPISSKLRQPHRNNGPD